MLTMVERFKGHEMSNVFIIERLNDVLRSNGIKPETAQYALIGSRNYGYHTEYSDFDIVGIYRSDKISSNVFSNETTGYIPQIVDTLNTQHVINGLPIIVNYTLWEYQKFMYFLAHQSLYPLEMLFSTNITIEQTLQNDYDLEHLASEYFKVNHPYGLMYNLISFARNAYDSVMNGKSEKTFFNGESKYKFYAKLRLFQAHMLYELSLKQSEFNFNNYKWLFRESVLTNEAFTKFEYSYNFANDLSVNIKHDLMKNFNPDNNRYEQFYNLYRMKMFMFQLAEMVKLDMFNEL